MSARLWRCEPCGKPKTSYVRHTCSPRAVDYYQAMQAAWRLVRQRFSPGFTRFSQSTLEELDAMWTLTAPAPLPRLVVPPTLPTPAVILLPTALLRETTAQRAGEPRTVKTRKYKDSRTISSLRKRCKCQRGMCTPAALATQYHSLNWTYSVALDAPPGELLAWVNYFRETGLKALDVLCSDSPRLCDPFWTLTIASHEPLRSFNPLRAVGLHAHLLVGNLDWAELQSLLKAWPGFVSPNAVQRATPIVWNALDYTLSQDPYTGDPFIDRYPSLRHLADYGSGSGLFYPPDFSPSLDGVLTAFRRVLRRRLSPAQRPEARRAARAS